MGQQGFCQNGNGVLLEANWKQGIGSQGGSVVRGVRVPFADALISGAADVNGAPWRAAALPAEPLISSHSVSGS